MLLAASAGSTASLRAPSAATRSYESWVWLTGAAAIVTLHRTETWWLSPALLVWGWALVAAACCDAVTQRVPTPLVRQAGGVTCVVLTAGLAVQAIGPGR